MNIVLTVEEAAMAKDLNVAWMQKWPTCEVRK